MNYYQETSEKIEALLSEGKKQEAASLIREELSMPYIPREFEEKLKELLNTIEPEAKEMPALSEEKILNYLHRDTEKQLIACEALPQLNLRRLLPKLQGFLLMEDRDPLAKALLLRELIAQEISEEVETEVNGVRYTFVPKYCLLPEESDGFQKAAEILKERYLQDPAVLQLSLQLLQETVLAALPVNMEEDDGEWLADDVCSRIEAAFGR
ncbi:MAG: hypothetical protein IKE21_05225 [Erysipelotrichaceae bacterium]|nr:hypothetical protein [Erysipelotrichaceae bacterium]